MIYLACDHRGFQLKEYLVTYLKTQLKLKFEDLGPKMHDPSDDAPDFAAAVAEKVVKNKENMGILICWTGHSMCITANKIKGVRAILGYSIEGAEMGRKHNDANILCLASKYLSNEHAAAVVKKFLQTEFDNDARLIRRNQKISALEKSQI